MNDPNWRAAIAGYRYRYMPQPLGHRGRKPTCEILKGECAMLLSAACSLRRTLSTACSRRKIAHRLGYLQSTRQISHAQRISGFVQLSALLQDLFRTQNALSTEDQNQLTLIFVDVGAGVAPNLPLSLASQEP